MRSRDLHTWDVTPEQAEALQRALAAELPAPRPLRGLERVAGAAVRGRGDALWVAVAVVVLPEMRVLESAAATGQARFPYRPGLLAAFEQITSRPDALLFAGHGAAHPRGLGLASHLGLLLEAPSVGCADRPLIAEGAPPGPNRGDRSRIFDEHGAAVAAWLRTRPQARPIVVSPGYAMGLDDAIEVALACSTRYRLPEPLREARRVAGREKWEVRSEK